VLVFFQLKQRGTPTGTTQSAWTIEMLERWAMQNYSFFPASTVLRFSDSPTTTFSRSHQGSNWKKKRQGSQFRRTVLAPWIRLQEYFLVHVLWLKRAEVKKLRFLHAKLWGTTAAGGAANKQSRKYLLDWPQRASNGMGLSLKPRSISRPDWGCQSTDSCGSLSHCAYTKGGRGLGAQTTKFTVT
jgi:hypothetical protein